MSYPRRNWTAAEWQAFNEQAKTLLAKHTLVERASPPAEPFDENACDDTESRDAWRSQQGHEARAINRDNRKAGAK